MTWLAPWALVGIAAVAVPVLVHWLARHQAMRVRFPTIQFLVQSSPVSVRRYRVKDLPLLAVRIGIVAAAALALAQPVWVRPGAPAARPARAIVLDTSASLQRTLPDGRVGAAVAQETAAAVTGSAATDRGPGGTGSSSASGAPAVTISTERVSEGVAQAAAWLATQVAPRELVVISDFQVGALVQSDLETVPADADVRLLPVAVSGPVPAPPAPARGQLRVLASREDAGAAAAAESAARSIVPPETSEVVLGLGTQNDLRGRFGVTVVFPGAENRDELRRTAQPVDTPELFAWVAGIQAHLRQFDVPAELVARLPAISYRLNSGLGVFPDINPGTEDAAAIMAAVLRAAAPPSLPVAEREPDTVPASTLQTWQRQVTPVGAIARPGDQSDGRWFWLLALVLFGVETWMRRRPIHPDVEVRHANAA